MLTREMAQQWVDAMKSGEYRHGYYAYKSQDASGICHCALGVLAEINGKPLTIDGTMNDSPEADAWLHTQFPDPIEFNSIFKMNDNSYTYERVIEHVTERYVQQA